MHKLLFVDNSQQINKGRIAAFFPLHHLKKLDEVKEEWLKASVYPWEQPLFLIKVTRPFRLSRCTIHNSLTNSLSLQEYFGEKLGLYFTFMGHYTKWLLVPALIGIPLQIYIVAVNDFSNPSQIGFAIFIVIWAVVMLEFWKRKEKLTSLEWGMTDYEEEEVARPGKKRDCLCFLVRDGLTGSID